MQVTLFRALQTIKVSDKNAEKVVSSMETFMKTRMEEAITPLKAEISAVKWLIGIFGLIISAASVATGIMVAFK